MKKLLTLLFLILIGSTAVFADISSNNDWWFDGSLLRTTQDVHIDGDITTSGDITASGTVTFVTGAFTTLSATDLTATNATLTNALVTTLSGANANLTGVLTVDTINEYTSANGVVIEGVTLKDSGVTATTGFFDNLSINLIATGGTIHVSGAFASAIYGDGTQSFIGSGLLVSGDLATSGSLTVDGTFSPANLDISGTITGATLITTGTSEFIGAVSGVSAAEVTMSSIGTPTYNDVQDLSNGIQSVGAIEGGDISANAGADGTIDVSATNGIIKTSNASTGANVFFDLTSTSAVALTDEDINYIAINYNSGVPIYSISTGSVANGHTIFNLGKVFREGTGVDIIDSGFKPADFYKKVQQHHVDEASLHFPSGAKVTEVAERYISISAGIMYAGINRIATDAINSSGSNTFEYYYYSGSWLESDATQINNTQYNDIAAGLATLSNNQYGIHWVYKGSNSNTYVVYGQDSYTLTEAQDEQPIASLPSHVSEMGVLRAKIIIQKSATSFTSILNVTDVVFTAQTASNHSDLGGLTTGDDHTQYLLVDGTRALTGNLSGTTVYMSSNLRIDGTSTLSGNITTNGTLTGATLSATASVLSVNMNASSTITGATISSTTLINAVNIDASGALSGATLDTGQGANELYDMDQNVLQASSVTFASITGTLTTVAQTNITSVGTLSSLAVGAGITLGTTITIDDAPAANVGHGMIIAAQVDSNTTGIGGLLKLGTDGNYDLADASSGASLAPASAIALSATTGSVTTVLIQGYFTNSNWSFTTGSIVYLGTGTSITGAYVQNAPDGAGDEIQILGIANTTTSFYFNPNLMLITLE